MKRGKKVLKDKERRSALQLLHFCGPTLIAFILVYNLFYDMVVTPVGRLLWAAALRMSPVSYITNNNLTQLFTSPLILAAVVIILIGAAYWNLFNISAIVLCLEYGRKGQKIRLRSLIRESFLGIRHVLHPRNWPILFFAAVIVPFSNIFMASNYISQIVIPQYIEEVLLDHFVSRLLLYGVIALAAFLTLHYLFIFQYFILERVSFAQAAKKSTALIRKRHIRSAGTLVLWNLRLNLRYFLWMCLGVLAVLIPGTFIGEVYTEVAAATTLVMEYITVPILSFLIQCLGTFAQYAFISVLYYCYGEEAVKAGNSSESGGAGEADESGEAGNPGEGDGTGGSVVPVKRGFGWLIPSIMMGTAVLSALSIALGAVLIKHGDLLDMMIEEQRAEVTSHRGYSAVAPENTIPAFQAAIDSKCQYAELDVQQTRDGVVVLTHDTSLKRCTGEDVNVYDITYEELCELDAGSFFSEEYAGTRIPTLDEVIKFCKGKIKLNIEIKNNGHSPELEKETVRIIQENDFVRDCVVTSISYDSLVKVKECDPEVKTGYILAMGVGWYYDLPDVDFFSIETSFVTPGMMREIHARGKEVHAWTVDRSSDARKMLSMGVDNIITGDPEMVLEEIHGSMNRILDILTVDRSIEDLQDYVSPETYRSLLDLYQEPEGQPKEEINEKIEGILNEA